MGIEPNSSRPLLKPGVSRADDATRTFASFVPDRPMAENDGSLVSPAELHERGQCKPCPFWALFPQSEPRNEAHGGLKTRSPWTLHSGAPTEFHRVKCRT